MKDWKPIQQMSSFSSRKVAWLMLLRQRLVTVLLVDTGVLRSWTYQVLERIIAGDFPQLSCLEYATWAEVFNKHSCVWKCRHCHSGPQNRLDLAQDMNCSYSTALTSRCVCEVKSWLWLIQAKAMLSGTFCCYDCELFLLELLTASPAYLPLLLKS